MTDSELRRALDREHTRLSDLVVSLTRERTHLREELAEEVRRRTTAEVTLRARTRRVAALETRVEDLEAIRDGLERELWGERDERHVPVQEQAPRYCCGKPACQLCGH